MKYFKREYWSFKLINIGIGLLPKESRNSVFISNCIKCNYIKLDKKEGSV